MTSSDRRTFRRIGAWLYDHKLKTLSEIFYQMAIADWEADQKYLRKRRKQILK